MREMPSPRAAHALRRDVEQCVKGIPISERFGVTVQVAAEFVGISRSRIYELLAAGELEGKVIHGRRIVLVQSLLRMLGEAPNAKRAAAA